VGERTDEIDQRGDEPVVDEAERQEDDAAEDVDADVAAEIEQKRDEIEITRSELSVTFDAIQEKLSPQRLVDEAKESVREATIGKAEHMVSEVGDRVRDTQMSLMDTIRENPLPAALAAIGLGWLWTKRSKSRSYGWGTDYERPGSRPSYRSSGWGTDYERSSRGPMRQATSAVGGAASKVSDVASGTASKVSDVASGTASKVGDVAGQAASTIGDMASDIKDTAGDFADKTQERLGDFGSGAQDWYQRTLDENPLVIGAAALAIGAAIGLALPETRREAELMGEARDRFMEKAKEVAQETGDRVQQAVKDVGDTGQAEVKHNSQPSSTYAPR